MRKALSIRSKRTSQVDASYERDLHARAEREAQRLRLDAFLASRDGGSSLTADALRGGIDLHAIVAAAGKVSDFADEALAIVSEEYRPALACREGCSYCCRKPGVLVTVPELLRLLFTIESRFDSHARSALASRAERYASQIEATNFNDATDDSVPCPLLVDERCSAYDVRPLVCRGYNSTSADACRAAHDDAQRRVPIFSVLKDVTDGATVGVSQSLREAGVNGAMLDLGSALNLALVSGDEFRQAIVAGSVEFADVENATWADDLWARVQEAARRG
jgi:Fe-S-cluster containining protein